MHNPGENNNPLTKIADACARKRSAAWLRVATAAVGWGGRGFRRGRGVPANPLLAQGLDLYMGVKLEG